MSAYFTGLKLYHFPIHSIIREYLTGDDDVVVLSQSVALSHYNVSELIDDKGNTTDIVNMSWEQLWDKLSKEGEYLFHRGDDCKSWRTINVRHIFEYTNTESVLRALRVAGVIEAYYQVGEELGSTSSLERFNRELSDRLENGERDRFQVLYADRIKNSKPLLLINKNYVNNFCYRGTFEQREKIIDYMINTLGIENVLVSLSDRLEGYVVVGYDPDTYMVSLMDTTIPSRNIAKYLAYYCYEIAYKICGARRTVYNGLSLNGIMCKYGITAEEIEKSRQVSDRNSERAKVLSAKLQIVSDPDSTKVSGFKVDSQGTLYSIDIGSHSKSGDKVIVKIPEVKFINSIGAKVFNWTQEHFSHFNGILTLCIGDNIKSISKQMLSNIKDGVVLIEYNGSSSEVIRELLGMSLDSRKYGFRLIRLVVRFNRVVHLSDMDYRYLKVDTDCISDYYVQQRLAENVMFGDDMLQYLEDTYDDIKDFVNNKLDIISHIGIVNPMYFYSRRDGSDIIIRMDYDNGESEEVSYTYFKGMIDYYTNLFRAIGISDHPIISGGMNKLLELNNNLGEVNEIMRDLCTSGSRLPLSGIEGKVAEVCRDKSLYIRKNDKEFEVDGYIVISKRDAKRIERLNNGDISHINLRKFKLFNLGIKVNIENNINNIKDLGYIVEIEKDYYDYDVNTGDDSKKYLQIYGGAFGTNMFSGRYWPDCLADDDNDEKDYAMGLCSGTYDEIIQSVRGYLDYTVFNGIPKGNPGISVRELLEIASNHKEQMVVIGNVGNRVKILVKWEGDPVRLKFN